MPHNSSQWVNHTFGGGWATDFGKTYYSSPNGADIRLPWLNKAENIQYTFDGRIQKAPGTRDFQPGNPAPFVALSGEMNIRGLYDYTKVGVAGSASTQAIIASGGDYFYVSGNTRARFGTYTYAGGVHDLIPHFSTFNDLLIIGESGGVAAPTSWDQTTWQLLSGTPPGFAFSVPHRGRQWAAGDPTTPSRLYYSAVGNPEDWVGAGSGSIDIDPGDGAEIVGLWSWKNELWLFKGDKKLSIHRISGSSPSDFARTPFIYGISAAGQHSIFSYGDDVYFWNPYGSLHSLKATDTYGDYVQAYTNYPILSWCQRHMSDLSFSQSTVHPIGGYGLSAFYDAYSKTSPFYGATANNQMLLMDFRFIQQESYPRFALWPYLTCHSVAFAKEYGGDPAMICGDGYGRVFELGQAEGVDGNGFTYTHQDRDIAATIESPYLTYGPPIETKTLVHVALNLAPDEHYTNTVTVAWNNETGFGQSTSVTRSFGVPLDTFVLDTDSLATNAANVASIEPMYGEFRSLQYTLKESSDKKITVQNFSALITPSGESLEA